jgi:predicted AAA+ superfamily ATPase
MFRTIEAELLRWKDMPGRHPLLLRGARQVGKTYVVQQFARTHLGHCVEVNFELHPQLKSIFETLNPADIISTLALTLNARVIPGQTLLFLDEIQECPQAIRALRYFYEKMPELHVIGAGSLLDFTLRSADFRAPVGRIRYLTLRPLSFLEFLTALGEQALSEHLATVTVATGVHASVHEKLLTLVRVYLRVGGMPAVIAEYLRAPHETSYQQVATALLQTYRDDFGKYARQVKHVSLQKVFDSAPRLVGQRYKFVQVDRESRSRELKEALSLLIRAGVIHQIVATSGAGLPLAAQSKEHLFKILFLDVGLMQRACGLDALIATATDFLAINAGAVAEQFVGQELLAYSPAYEDPSLFFWQRERRGSQAEVDYLLSVAGTVIPVEVKAGKTGRLRSLKQFMSDYGRALGVRLSQAPLSFEDGVLSVPLYAIAQLPRLLREVIPTH